MNMKIYIHMNLKVSIMTKYVTSRKTSNKNKAKTVKILT